MEQPTSLRLRSKPRTPRLRARPQLHASTYALGGRAGTELILSRFTATSLRAGPSRAVYTLVLTLKS